MTNIEVFQKRWATITNETLSSVRRQVANPYFDNSVINKDFHASCTEWFDGSLAPHIWYQLLEKEYPDVAEKFKRYVLGLKLSEQSISNPPQWISYAGTALSLPICYIAIGWLTNMGFISKAVFSLGIAVMVWYICQSLTKSKHAEFEEQVVNFYKNQLQVYYNNILQILS